MGNTARETLAAIEGFLASASRPVLQESGAKLMPLAAGRYSLAERGGWVLLEAWDEETNVARRITAVRHQRPGRLDLAVELFGKRAGEIVLVDLDRAPGATAQRTAGRREFRERFGYFLNRNFTGWRVEGLTTEPDLQRSLSPTFPRAMLRKGRHALAAMGAADAPSADGALAFALVWLDYLRRREPALAVDGVVLYIPESRVTTTCLRLRCVRPEAAQFSIYAYTAGGAEARIDPRDSGNVDTRLTPLCAIAPTQRNTPEARLEQLVRRNITTVSASLLPEPVYGQVPAIAGVERGVLDLLAVERGGRLAVIELKASEDLQLPVQALDYWTRVEWHAMTRSFAGAGYFPGMELRAEAPRLYLVGPAMRFHPTTETLLRFFDPRIDVERVGLAEPWDNGLRVMFRATGAQTPSF